MDLPVCVDDPIEAALRADVQATIRQHRHDLPRWQCRKCGLAAGEQDPLALLLAWPVRDKAWRSVTAIMSVPITCKGLAPSLQGAQADADLAAGMHQTHARGIGLADQLDRLAALSGTGQPSSSSKQKVSYSICITSNSAISVMAFSLR